MSLKHPIQSPENGILLKWFVTNNQSIQSDQLLAHIRRISPDPGSNEKTDDDLITIKSHHEGNFKRITLEGHKIQINDIIGEIIECTHPAVFRNLCVSCGKKILIPPQSTKQTNSTHGAKLTMAGGQTIQLSKLEAQQRQTTKLASMQKSRKLALILDLDSTLVHATAYIPFPKEILDKVKPIQLEDNGFIVRFLNLDYFFIHFL